MDEKKVELTDEEIVKDIERSTGMPSYWKIIVLDLIHRLQAENKRLSIIASILDKGVAVEIVNMQETIDTQKAKIERLKIQVMQGLKDMKLEVGIRDKEIKRLEEENEKLKTLVSHFEQLEKQLSAEIERLTEEKWKVQDDLDNYHAMLQESEKKNAELQKQVDEQDKEIDRLEKVVHDQAEQYYDCEQRTAKEIIKWIKLNGLLQYGGYVIHDSTLEKIGKKYGVEVE